MRRVLADFAFLSLADRELTIMNGHAMRGFQYFGRKVGGRSPCYPPSFPAGSAGGKSRSSAL